MDGRDGAPWVRVPERLDRRLRVGPFASGRDAAKFVAAAAVGAAVSLAVVPWAGLPVVAVGAIVALWRPDGEPLDERAGAFARWALRRAAPEPAVTALPGGPPSSGRTLVRLADGRSAAIVRAAGVPLAFLPPADLATQFDRYRELLRSVDGSLYLLATSAPVFADAVRPPGVVRSAPESAARDGYAELVALLARRRSIRRVLVALAMDASGPDGPSRLESAAELLRQRLEGLGLRPEPLRGPALGEAARRLGLTGTGGRP